MSFRNAELAKIHIAKKDLAMDEDTYRMLLKEIGGSKTGSSKDLTALGRAKVLEHMKKIGWKPKPRKGKKRTTPAAGRDAMIAKIRAILIEAKREDAYADGMAKNMFKVDRFEWCNPSQLHKIVAALVYDQRRRNAKGDA